MTANNTRSLGLPVFTAWPTGLQAMLTVEAEIDNRDLTMRELEIIRLRCSFLNKCDFCFQLHAKKAAQAGLPEEEISLIASQGDLSNNRSDSLLIQLADAVTLLNDISLEETVTQAKRCFGEAKTITALYAIGQINSWNRIARGAEIG